MKNDLPAALRAFCAIAACAPASAFAQLSVLHVPDFSTVSATFQPVPGSTITANPNAGENILILAQGALSASMTGVPAGELQIVDANGFPWMSATVDTNVIGAPQAFTLLDASPSGVVLHTELRSPAGATVQLTNLTYFTLAGIDVTQLVEQGAVSKQYVDAGWQTAITVNIDTTHFWVLLAVGAVRSLTPNAPVGVRVVEGPPNDEAPPSVTGDLTDPFGCFVSTSTGFHGFFTPIRADATTTTVMLQIDPDPGNVGNTAEVKEARVLALTNSTIGIQSTPFLPGGQSGAGFVQIADATFSTTPQATYLGLSGAYFQSPTGEAGLRTTIGTTSVTSELVTASTSTFQVPIAHFQELVATDVTVESSCDTFSPMPPATSIAWGSYAGLLGPFAGNLIDLTPDGGGASDAGAMPDAGPAPDAGAIFDGGSRDSGTLDAGTPDAGTPDAGAPDSGSRDAGAADAGSADAGPRDGGRQTPELLSAGCGCHSASGAWLLLLLLTRPGFRSRRRPRESSR